MAEKRKALLAAADNNTIKEELKKAMAREQIEAIPDHVEQGFIHDFHNWVAGIGKRSDYVKAGVPLASVGQGKLVSDHPSVLNYVEGITSRVIDYYAEIANMKMRGPAIGRRGGPATLNDLWLYFKYVVRNEPVDPRDFQPQPGPSEPDEALVGNQEGIVDEKTEAPSMRAPGWKKRYTGEERVKRGKPADPQVRKKVDPKEVREEAAEEGKDKAAEEEKAKEKAARERADREAKEKAERDIEAHRAAIEREYIDRLAQIRAEASAVAVARAEAERRAAEAEASLHTARTAMLFRDAEQEARLSKQAGEARVAMEALARENEARERDALFLKQQLAEKHAREEELARLLNSKEEEKNALVKQVVDHFRGAVAEQQRIQAELHARAEYAAQIALLTENAASARVMQLADQFEKLRAEYSGQLVLAQQAGEAIAASKDAERAAAVRAYEEAMERLDAANRQLVAVTESIDKESRDAVIAYEGMKDEEVAYGKVSEKEEVALHEKNREKARASAAFPSAAPEPAAAPPTSERTDAEWFELLPADAKEVILARYPDIKKNPASLRTIVELAQKDPTAFGELLDAEKKRAERARAKTPAAAETPPPAAAPPSSKKRGRGDESTAAETPIAATVEPEKMSAKQWLEHMERPTEGKRGSGNHAALAAELLRKTGTDEFLAAVVDGRDPGEPAARVVRVLRLLMQEQGAFAGTKISKELDAAVLAWLKKKPALYKKVMADETRSTGLGK